SALTGIAFGLMPAMNAARQSDARGLRGGSSALGAVRARARAVLVVAEVALSLTLLAGGALMVEGLRRLAGPELGFQPEGVLTARIQLPEQRYPDSAARSQFHARIVERLAVVPGVTEVALMNRLPSSGGTATVPVRAELRDVGLTEGSRDAIEASLRIATPGAFRVLRLPLVSGRDFGPGDDASSARVAIVNETFARRTWRDRSALGRRVIVPASDGSAQAHTVIGVARDVKRNWIERDIAPMVYVADAQRGAAGTSLLVRGSGMAPVDAPAVRAALAALDPEVAVGPLFDFATDLAEHTSGVRIAATTMSLLGVFSLLLAAIGLYGLIAFQVARRTAEFGVRMALGAQRGDILSLVFGEGARLVGVGFAVGVPLATAACWAMTALMFGVVKPSAMTLGGIVLTLCVVAACALGWPAWRASQLDPAESLRRD
ncbi:MAG: FtsX-like permease family protein, partial [Candidatus Eisenbacteria bacterium]